MHFHRDLLAICDSFARHVLRPSARRPSSCGTPAAGLHLRARRPRAVSAARRRRHGARSSRRHRTQLLDAIATIGATICFTAPTAYRAHAGRSAPSTTSASLRKCVSAGEPLPEGDLRRLARARPASSIIDGIGVDRDAAHLHRGRRAPTSAPARPAGRCRATRRAIVDDDGNDAAARHGRPPRGPRPDRLPLSRRRAPDGTTCRRLEPHRRRLPSWTRTAISGSRRAPTT